MDLNQQTKCRSPFNFGVSHPRCVDRLYNQKNVLNVWSEHNYILSHRSVHTTTCFGPVYWPSSGCIINLISSYTICAWVTQVHIVYYIKGRNMQLYVLICVIIYSCVPTIHLVHFSDYISFPTSSNAVHSVQWKCYGLLTSVDLSIRP